jgi:hypothetical protein
MKKNVAGQKIGAQMIDATSGAAFTATVTVYVTGDAGTQAIGSVGSGVCTHKGNGYHTYAPSQAETNYALAAFTFIGTGAIPQTVQVFTNFPQSGDAYAAIGSIPGGTTPPTVDQIADEIETRNLTVGTVQPAARAALADTTLQRASSFWEAGAAPKSLGAATMKLTHKVSSVAGSLTTYRSDDSTPHMTQTETADAAADPLVGLGGAS